MIIKKENASTVPKSDKERGTAFRNTLNGEYITTNCSKNDTTTAINNFGLPKNLVLSNDTPERQFKLLNNCKKTNVVKATVPA